jgi:hypothetical protein
MHAYVDQLPGRLGFNNIQTVTYNPILPESSARVSKDSHITFFMLTLILTKESGSTTASLTPDFGVRGGVDAWGFSLIISCLVKWS